jgi:hypothetical protein
LGNNNSIDSFDVAPYFLRANQSEESSFILHPLSISIRAARDKILKPTLVHDKGRACAPAAAKKAYGELKTSLRAP